MPEASIQIVGAGPAGCLLARELALRGHEVHFHGHRATDRRLPEKTVIPSALGLLKRLGLLSQLDAGAHRGTARHGIIWGSSELR